MNREKLKKAVANESAVFEEFYLWLDKSMPEVFFREVDEEKILSIVHGLMGFKVQDYFVQIHLRDSAITLCFDSAGADLNILKSYPMYGIKNYTTYVSKEPLPFPDNPGLLRIGLIEFTTSGDAKSHDEIDAKFLQKLDQPQRESILRLYNQALMRDECQYEVMKNGNSMHILIAWKNIPKHNFLYRLAKVVHQHNLRMQNFKAAYCNPHSPQNIFLLSFGILGNQGESASDACDIKDFLTEIASLKYFGSSDSIEETFVATQLLSGNLANLLRAMMNFIHQLLVHQDPNLYSLENVQEGLTRHPELTCKIIETFVAKFHPEKRNPTLAGDLREQFLHLVKRLDTGNEELDLRRKTILFQGMNFVDHLYKTNFYQSNKSAFAFRLDPHYLDHAPFERRKIFPEMPYGVFFFKGMHYIGFHVRFKDLARGGLRTILPQKKEKVVAERHNVFLECYHLALTQQKKNKDIPEGGAKGVIFLKPDEWHDEEVTILRHELQESGMEEQEIEKRLHQYESETKLEYLYQTQRSYVKAFLSLINCESDGKLKESNIVDYWRRPEYIYLGPDENMHNAMIEWIAEESKRVGYKPGGAFISGKSDVGINHKEYGVTSFGVNVYMHEVLLYMGLDPAREPFTVKMTGGPDGDVAGNEIHNLYRFYPNTAKLLALTDVSGTIFDPFGLDLATCVDLFRKELSIRNYPAEKLSPGGFLLDRETRREVSQYIFQTLCKKNIDGKIVEEWLHGNEMNALFRTNVHKTKTDMFLPCGGRPRTLRDTNLDEFLDVGGKPTSRAIVEGANLYLSSWAREALEEKGVVIIKDSSANKGGVISSSFEILSGLALSDAEFLECKAALVDEILERISKLSYEEGKLLLDTHRQTKEKLSAISDQISARINYYTDQLLDYLEKIELSNDPEDPLVRCFLGYCLKTLREKFRDKLLREIPPMHKKAVIASHIASRIVYKRGLNWAPSLVEVLPLILKEEELFA